MTRQEMVDKYLFTAGENNYEEAQRRIKDAMMNGDFYVLLPKEEFKEDFGWWATGETIGRLINDGFDINKVWQPDEYWSVEWYED